MTFYVSHTDRANNFLECKGVTQVLILFHQQFKTSKYAV